ncbi:MarR family winged helix-turn-helix transcriptional regulator [Candidatus Enterococcus ikei]|uniref:MarR family transcriptional regulator n=1 Tax=Candidatus Enterococcus ikei TaxID=2815326 RepID=A0ABS3GVA7_9ENTE|nr:MarR family transcriptional regulator [Enterococcus sp. DIV0869a]MBO0439186.1 MarR family transcriptional regulator [Enterococcus sp. DIV0869a]
MDRKIGLKIRILANELNRKAAEILKEDNGEASSSIQMRILNFIHRRNSQQIPVYQKDIEQEFDIRRSTATGVLQTMEKRLFIERSSCKEDNRFKTIILTDLGQQKVKENIVKLHKFDELLVQGISEEDLTIFFKLMDKLSENSKKINKEGERVT